MKKWTLVLFITISLILTACDGDPTLDTSSKEAMTSSMQKMMLKLSKKDQRKLQQTVTGIYMAEALANIGKKINSEQLQKKISAKLDGKTAEEIFEMGEDMRKKMKQ